MFSVERVFVVVVVDVDVDANGVKCLHRIGGGDDDDDDKYNDDDGTLQQTENSIQQNASILLRMPKQ